MNTDESAVPTLPTADQSRLQPTLEEVNQFASAALARIARVSEGQYLIDERAHLGDKRALLFPFL